MSTSDADETTDADADRPAAAPGDGAQPDDRDAGRDELAAQVELLEDENRRLRAEYARARQSQYRRTAAGLAAVGLVAALGGLVVPDGREVLFALAAIGLFGGVLTYYLTPGAFVAAAVGDRVYDAMATNEAALVDELGLTDERVYLPAGEASAVRLYVPQRATDEPPDEFRGPIITDAAHRGLVLEPTGAGLFEAFERALTGELASAPAPLATQLADGLVEQFELAGGADPDVNPEGGRVTVAVRDSAFGAVDRFDHPIASFLAVGFAAGLERPIRLEVAPGDDGSTWLVTCRWNAGGEKRGSTDEATAADDAADGDEDRAVTAEHDAPGDQ